MLFRKCLTKTNPNMVRKSNKVRNCQERWFKILLWSILGLCRKLRATMMVTHTETPNTKIPIQSSTRAIVGNKLVRLLLLRKVCKRWRLSMIICEISRMQIVPWICKRKTKWEDMTVRRIVWWRTKIVTKIKSWLSKGGQAKTKWATPNCPNKAAINTKVLFQISKVSRLSNQT